MRAALLALLLLAPGFEDLEKAYSDAVSKNEWRTVRGVAEQIAKLDDQRALRFLLTELDYTSDEPHRRALFRAIAFADFPERKEFVVAQLGSEDPYLRATALEAYAEIDASAAAVRAGDLLEIDEDARVRWTAARVLVEGGGTPRIQLLLTSASGLASDERGAILRLVQGLKPERLLSARKLLDSEYSEWRLMAVLALAASGSPEFAPDLEEARADKDPRIALAASVGLARLTGDGKASAMAALLKRAKSFDQRWELYDLIGLAGLRDKALAQALAKEARSGKKLLRPKASEALGHAGGSFAVKDLATLIKAEKPWQLPIGATRGLAATRSPEAMPVLIEALEKKAPGRVSQEIAQALESLTGQPFGRDAELWKRWWSERGAGFEVPVIAHSPWEEETAAADRYAFYGIQLVSRSAVFVCDISGSMQGDRIDTLRRELTAVVKRFPPAGRFNVVFFNEKVNAWSKRLVSASKKNKGKLLGFIEGIEAGGATNIWDALQLALSDKEVDTLVLLSDGAPTAGKLRSTAEIGKAFTKQNRARMVLLHVVSIGKASPNLRAMARLTGGSYVQR